MGSPDPVPEVAGGDRPEAGGPVEQQAGGLAVIDNFGATSAVIISFETIQIPNRRPVVVVLLHPEPGRQEAGPILLTDYFGFL